MKKFKKGFGLIELLISAVVLALLLSGGFLIWSSVFQQERALAGHNSFHVKIGTMLESLKQDLRSVKKLSVASNRLDLVRISGFDAGGELKEELVTFELSKMGIEISRNGKRQRIDFQNEMKVASGSIDLYFKLHQMVRELDIQKGVVGCTIRILDSTGVPLKGYVASISVKVEARELSG